eukprot:gene10-12_t
MAPLACDPFTPVPTRRTITNSSGIMQGAPCTAPSPFSKPSVSGDCIAMLDEVYNKRILSLAADIPLIGRLTQPDATATAHSKLCGSTVTVDIRMEHGIISDFAHIVKACALGQASSSIMARHVIGATAEEVRAVREAVRQMLKANGPAPNGRFAEAAVLEPVRDFKARHASTLLTFDAKPDALRPQQPSESSPSDFHRGPQKPQPFHSLHDAVPREIGQMQ